MPRLNIESWTATTAVLDGREVIAFGGCNYLGLAHHPDVLNAARRGLERYGLSTTASRETTGNTAAHQALEAELAAFLRMPSAIITPEGYTANLALGQALAVDTKIAIIDDKSHRSVVHLARAAGLQVVTYPHGDAEAAAALVRQHKGQRLCVLTDGVFAADGSVAPADDLLAALPPDGLLVIDDCHGFCVLGKGGRGLCEHLGLHDDRICITTTLAKGLGCYGGAVIGTRALIDRVREVGGVYRGTTPAPPALAEAAREALRVIDREKDLVLNLQHNAVHAREMLASIDPSFAPPAGRPPVAIFTFTLSTLSQMEKLERDLINAGFFVPLIDYPGGPQPRYFRLTVSAKHTAGQIAALGEAINAALKPAQRKTLTAR